jgi:CBS domain containing-hemolysin-like protein
VRQLGLSEWLVRGDVTLADLRDYGIELETDTAAYNTVGGLVLGSLGHLPHKGETISADGFSLMVDAVRENRIDLVRTTRREDSSEH